MKANFGIRLGLFILRVVAGGTMMIAHGLPKLMSFEQKKNMFPDPIGLGSQFSLVCAIGAEFACALLLVLGVATRLVSIPLLFTMLVAFLIVHSADPFSNKELAFLYATCFLTLSLTGGGMFSLGHQVKIEIF